MARRLIASVLSRRWMYEQQRRSFSAVAGSTNKLFVGGLSYRTDEEGLRRAFSQHGEVVEVRLISDRETGRPKGFGFVTFESEADAETARSKMTGQLLDGRVIRVDKATPSRPPLPSSGFGASSTSGGGGFTSPLSSSLPPVAEDWGTIPSNVVDFGAGASSKPAAPVGTGFDVDTSKPFDSSTFGQAAASWPSYTPAPPSNASTQTASRSSSSSVISNTSGSASSSTSESFGSASTFSSGTFGSAVNTSSTSPSSPASSSSTSSTFQAATNTTPTSVPAGHTSSAQPSTSGTANNSSFGAAALDAKPFDSSTFGSASFKSTTATVTTNMPSANASTSSSFQAVSGTTINTSSTGSTTAFGAAGNLPPSSTPISVSSSAQPNTAGTTNTTGIGSATAGGKPFDSSTFGSASVSASKFGSASFYSPSVSGNTNTTSASVGEVPEATILESHTSTVSSTAGTITSAPSSGAAITSKPVESVAGAGATTPTTTTSNTTSAHPLNSPALTSSGTFDFSNFSFNNSSYRDNDPPLPRRRPRPRPRPASQTMTTDFSGSGTSLLEMRSPFGSNNQFAETSIPKPKGTEMDLGLLNITAPSPPGLRPQGVFDIYLPDDLPEIPPPEPKPKPKPMSLSMFPHRQLPALDLPYHTPEADNWSDIGKDPPKYDLSTLFPSMGELLKKEKELHWDPYNFDPEFKLPPEEKVIIQDSDYDEPWEKEDED